MITNPEVYHKVTVRFDSPAEMGVAQRWCKVEFGLPYKLETLSFPRWHYRLGSDTNGYYMHTFFKNDEDATLYKLTWL